MGSRRACEEYIAAGRVSVNGKIVTLGAKADAEHDKIEVDGRPIKLSEALVYIALYKPRGYLSTASDEEGRSTVLDLVPVETRLYPVGRLDYDSEGLILLTNDGELAYRLSHPRFGHEKEYRVLVARHPDDDQLDSWRRGIVLEDGYRTLPAQVQVDQLFGKGAWLRVIIHEGRKRQIREMGALTGLPVVRIIRVRISTLQLGGMKTREWRYLTPTEIESLQGKVSVEKPRAKRRPISPAKPKSKFSPRPTSKAPYHKSKREKVESKRK